MRRALPLDRLSGDGSAAAGLAADDVAARRTRYGPNAIVDTPAHPWRTLARDTMRDPMLWFLAGVAVLYAAVGQRTESVILLVAIIPLVVMDLVLHRRTSASIAGLQSRLAARAVVIREGRRLEIPAVDLVPGDLVLVVAGSTVPADGLVVGGTMLQMDESILTGEAYPVAKQSVDIARLDGGEGDAVLVGGD